MNLKEIYNKYSPYFVDVWQYVVIIIMFILAEFLCDFYAIT